MQKRRVTNLFSRFPSNATAVFKIITPILLVVLLFASMVTPLHAQLSPARDLTGTWQSSATGMYYEMDPSDPSTRMDDVTVNFAMDITQQGSEITITLHLNSVSWITDNAYWNEYGMSGVPPILDAIEFKGTVSSSSFSAVEQYTSFNPEHLVGTFTSDIITATLNGDSWTTDTNGIVVTRTDSPSSTPTLSPTSTPSDTSPPATPPPTNPYDLGSVGLVRGSAWLKNSGGETQLTSKSQVGAGSQVRTGSDAIVSFNYPDQGGIVYLGENTEVGWVGLESHPAPDSQVTFTTIPSDVKNSFDWGEEGMKLFAETLGGASLEMLLTGAVDPYVLGAEVAVHGGLILVHYGQFYIRENGWPQLLQVPQGFIQGENTEYSVVVTNETTVIRVIDGPLVFLDPISNSSVTLITGQMLTLPAAQQNGFTQQTLLSDTTAFNPASTDQWWTQATGSTSPLSFLTEQPVMLAGFIAVIAIVITALAVTVTKRRKTESAQPTASNTSGTYPNKSISKTQLITQAIISLVVFAVVGYVLLIVFNSQLGLDEELVNGVSFSMFMEILIIPMLSIGYVVALVQQVRSYRRQNLKLPLQIANGKSETSMHEVASQPVPQPSMIACPNCRNQLHDIKGVCPFCGLDLRPPYSNAKK
jgi:hypothetical protein